MYIVLFMAMLRIDLVSQSFVEVIITDSIHIKPKSIEYVITCIPESFATGKIESADSQKSAEQDILRILKTNNISYTAKSRQNYSITNYNHHSLSKSYAIQFSRKQELESFVELVGDVKNITGKIGEIDYEVLPMHNEMLLRKLIVKAKIEAGMIADNISKILGEIMSVEILDKDPNSLLFELMTKTEMAGYNLSSSQSLYKKVYKKARVKFEAN